MPAIIDVLGKFKEKLARITDERFDPPFPTMNIGVVQTGDDAAKNKIPDYCRLDLDIRPLPGQDVEEIYDILARLIGAINIDGLKMKLQYGKGPTPPMETPCDNKIVQLAEEIFGRAASSKCFNTEGGVFNREEAKTVICGPASISDAHKPDEFVHTKWLDEKIVRQYESGLHPIIWTTT